nr:winged helix-turn-helix transcriptional regulator [Methanoplanus limicola]
MPEPEFTVTDGFRTVIHLVKAEEKPSDKTEITRNKTEITRDKTESTRDKTEITRDKTEITRDKTESTREETESTRDKTEETREKIIALISENPFVTMDEMAQKTGISSKGIEWQIKKLKISGRIKRSGPRKGGHWEIAGDGND